MTSEPDTASASASGSGAHGARQREYVPGPDPARKRLRSLAGIRGGAVIIALLLLALVACLVWLLQLFPVFEVETGSMTGLWGLLADMNYFLPISEIFAVTFAVFMLFPALMGVTLVSWIVALIRGGSSRG